MYTHCFIFVVSTLEFANKEPLRSSFSDIVVLVKKIKFQGSHNLPNHASSHVSQI